MGASEEINLKCIEYATGMLASNIATSREHSRDPINTVLLCELPIKGLMELKVDGTAVTTRNKNVETFHYSDDK